MMPLTVAKIVHIRGDYFRFGLVFIKKNNQTDFFFKNRNQFKPTGFRFGFLGQNRFKPVLLGFFRFVSVFFGLGWFGFFGFRLIKPKPNRTGRFFQNFNRFNRFFFTVRFFRLIFSRFS